MHFIYQKSRIKNNTAIYIKNPNPELYKSTGNIKKSTEFIKMDIYIYIFIEELEDDQTIELNAYITNIEDSILKTAEIHLFYSLRWQVELMFKVWKSIFKINQVKKIKIQRFKCFLYGRLIALLLSYSIVFTAKNIILENEDKEISNFKSFDKVIEYFPMIRQENHKRYIRITNITINFTYYTNYI